MNAALVLITLALGIAADQPRKLKRWWTTRDACVLLLT
jgi:hypothetical protein